jgi:hypothetical protein
MIELPGGALVDIPETVLEVGAVTIHEHKAPARLIERWKNKDAFRALQRSYLPEVREVENALWLVWVSRFVDYAADEQLDMIGRIVGELRQGRTDANYRLRVKARILINKSFGRVDDILEMLQVIEPAQASITEFGVASFRVNFDGPLEGVSSLAEIASLISEARAAGVGGAVVAPTSEALGLRWDDVSDLTRRFSVVAGTADVQVGVGNVSPNPPASTPEGTLLCLHACDEDGVDFATPSGWTLQENRLLDTTGPARHKLWTRLMPASGGGVALAKASGAGLAIARMYAVYGPINTVVSCAHVGGSVAPATTPLIAGPRERSIVFTALDTARALGAYAGSGVTWNVIGSATSGAAASGVGIHAHWAFDDVANPPAGSASNPGGDPIGDWGTFTMQLSPETLSGWGYGLLADRRRA